MRQWSRPAATKTPARDARGGDEPREREVLEQRILDGLVPADRFVGIAPEQHELSVGERAPPLAPFTRISGNSRISSKAVAICTTRSNHVS